jgi:hypothetical protein
MEVPMRTLTKSPKAFAKMALAIGKEGLSSYSCSKSPHVYTQPQLFALLAIKNFFNTDYRGIIAMLKDWPELVAVLGLKRLPNFSTLKYAQDRFLEKGASELFSTLPSASPSGATCSSPA